MSAELIAEWERRVLYSFPPPKLEPLLAQAPRIAAAPSRFE
jgi:hypothetical protein